MTAGWLLAVVKKTGLMVKAPEVTALTHFDELPADKYVWCDTGHSDGRPRAFLRGDLVRIEEYAV